MKGLYENRGRLRFLLNSACALLAVLMSSSVFGDEQGRVFQALDYYRFETVRKPAISPDGNWVAYLHQSADIQTDQYQTQLILISSVGGQQNVISAVDEKPGEASWSPDSRRIAYVANAEEARQIYQYDLATQESRLISALPSAASKLVWSPDGSKIAFVMFVSETAETILKSDPEIPVGAEWAALPREITEQYYRWDGHGYREPGVVQLFVLDVKTGEHRQLSSGDFDHGGPYALPASPSWSSDGKYIVFSLYRQEGEKNQFELQQNVYRYAVSDGSVEQLTSAGGIESNAKVSPDGKYIAYQGHPQARIGKMQSDLYIMPYPKGAAKNLTQQFDRDIQTFAWSGDSKSILAVHGDMGTHALTEIDLNADHELIYRGTGTTTDGQPYLDPPDFSLAATGQFALARSTPEHPAEVFTGHRQSAAITRLTRHTDALLAGVHYNPAETFYVTSKTVGHKIQAWMIKPPNFDPDKSYPLIMDVHGGPFAAYSGQFSMMLQLAAAQGYVLAYSNPRGSTGYGNEYMQGIENQFPIPDSGDVLQVVDQLQKKPFIDANNLFLMGGSGGGLVTGYTIGQTDRFNAAALHYPVINWKTMIYTGDKPIKFSQVWMKGMPWEDTENYERRSPISYVQNVKTPSIIITGEKDYRTPMVESEQFYGALKLMGVDAALIRFPDDAHGNFSRPSSTLRGGLYATDWFDRYKK